MKAHLDNPLILPLQIGVLLCNVRPAFQEERRFCYEVKTKDTAILLQAETQSDLTSWIEIFEQAKRKAVESSSSTADQAFAIIPPSAPAPELSVKDHLHHDENISMGFDRSLTLPLSGVQPPDGLRGTVLARISDQNKGKNADNQRALSPGAASNPSTGAIGFGALISATHGAFPMDFRTQQGNSPVSPASPYGASAGDISITQSQLALLPSTPKNSLAPTTLAHTPAPGSLAKAAAITAFSSQVNSSDLRMGARSQGGHKKTQSLDINTSSGGLQKGNTGALFYPPNYPGQLRAQDIHFRSLFPGEAMGQPILLGELIQHQKCWN